MNFSRLEGQRVILIPLEDQHIDALFACSRDDEVWEYLPIKINSIDEMRTFVENALQAKETQEEFPYAVYDKYLNKIVGTTRYLRISEYHRTINVGWTWYSTEVWRSRVNTEAKYLLFKQVFESWGARRIELITTPNHTRSQRAIERLGAVREGLLRKKYNNTDYVVFSIVDSEWEDVKRRLEQSLDQRR